MIGNAASSAKGKRVGRPAIASAGNYPKGAAKREAILTGVLALLGTERHFNLNLRFIGQALNIKPAHILYYFSSREDLFQRVIERWDGAVAIASVPDRPHRSDLDLLLAAVRRNVAMPGMIHLYHALAAEAIDPAHVTHAFFRDRFTQLRQMLGDAIRLEQAQGGIAADVDADRAARELIALADGLQLQSLVDSSIDAVADLAAAIDRLRR